MRKTLDATRLKLQKSFIGRLSTNFKLTKFDLSNDDGKELNSILTTMIGTRRIGVRVFPTGLNSLV